MSCFKRGAGKHPIFLLQWIIPMISQKLKICLRSCCFFLVVIWHTVHQSSHASGCVFFGCMFMSWTALTQTIFNIFHVPRSGFRSQVMMLTTDLSIIHYSSHTKISPLPYIQSDDRAVLCNMRSFKQVGPQRSISIIYRRFSKRMWANNHKRVVWQIHIVCIVLQVLPGMNYMDRGRTTSDSEIIVAWVSWADLV